MIKIISKGLYTTIQDEGRFGYRNIGVPSSGYMDRESAQIANLIIDNPININFFIKSIYLLGVSNIRK